MPNFNKVILMGNLTRDPELRYLPNQTAVVSFGMAVNRKWKDPQGNEREEVLFVDLTAFARAAEVISQYVRKGNPLFIEGRLKLDMWEDKNGGGKRSKLSVVVDSFQLMGNKAEQRPAPADAGSDWMPDETPPPAPARSTPPPPPARAAVAPTPPRPQSLFPPKAPATAPLPYGDEQHFQPDDIPF